jgi:hypothetical protein
MRNINIPRAVHFVLVLWRCCQHVTPWPHAVRLGCMLAACRLLLKIAFCRARRAPRSRDPCLASARARRARSRGGAGAARGGPQLRCPSITAPCQRPAQAAEPLASRDFTRARHGRRASTLQPYRRVPSRGSARPGVWRYPNFASPGGPGRLHCY